MGSVRAMQDPITLLADRLDGARRVLFVTGAGLSADSGLPTYRGVGGLYEDDEAEAGRPIEQVLSGPTLAERPELVWKHIARLEAACRGAAPNRGHAVIAELGQTREVVVLTQNVDGFHARAGSQNVIDIHGDVHDLMCTACRWHDRVEDYAALRELPPRCPDCGAVVRPGVVLFEEMLPEAKLERLEAELGRGFDVAVAVGTSALFAYIGGPIAHLRRAGCFTAEINPGPSELSEVVELVVRDRAASALGRVADLVERFRRA